MNFFVLSGSQRHNSQSSKVGKYIASATAQLFPDASVFSYDLSANPLPLWDDWIWNKESEAYQAFAPQWEPLAEEIKQADAFVIITPEWAGMTTPAIKNFFLYANAPLIGNKPCMLVSVSAGRGGRYPIAEMRMSSYKNSQICYIPQHVIVDHVNDVLNDDLLTGADKADTFIKERILYSIKVLREYGVALSNVRMSGAIDLEKYPYGM